MFFTISKVLTPFTYPLALAVVLLVVAWLLRERRGGRALFWVVLLGLYVLSTRPVADLLLLPLEARYEGVARPADADAIVVLGGFSNLRRSTPERLELHGNADRFVEAVVLAGELPGAVIIFSGGSGDLLNQDSSEAPLAKAYAARLGIPEHRMRAEATSRNTHENAVETARIVRDEGLGTVVLITSAMHMKRALACFHRAGLAPVPYPVDFQNTYPHYSILSFAPAPGNLADATFALKEHVGLLIYRLKGYA